VPLEGALRDAHRRGPGHVPRYAVFAGWPGIASRPGNRARVCHIRRVRRNAGQRFRTQLLTVAIALRIGNRCRSRRCPLGCSERIPTTCSGRTRTPSAVRPRTPRTAVEATPNPRPTCGEAAPYNVPRDTKGAVVRCDLYHGRRWPMARSTNRTCATSQGVASDTRKACVSG
jgi:hypothetical protein